MLSNFVRYARRQRLLRNTEGDVKTRRTEKLVRERVSALNKFRQIIRQSIRRDIARGRVPLATEHSAQRTPEG